MHINTDKIHCVVVTHNRRKLLEQSLYRIRDQEMRPHKIFLIDNNSTDGTADLLSRFDIGIDIAHIRLPQNLGGAAGFHLGIKLAYEEGADWIWCMDDDCFVTRSTLKRLLDAKDLLISHGLTNIGFLSSRVLWKDGSPCLMNLPVPDWLWIQPQQLSLGLLKIIGSSFVSIMISRSAVRTIGLPVKQFFIWFDDAEYTRRISESFNSYLVSSSVVTHMTPSNFPPLDFSALDKTVLWKFKYGVRNETAYLFRRHGAFHAILFFARLVRRLRRTKKLWYLLPISRAFIIGLFFNYIKYIEYPLPDTTKSQPSD